MFFKKVIKNVKKPLTMIKKYIISVSLNNYIPS
jgi:hypothetical protein